jgi:hypothetical protein
MAGRDGNGNFTLSNPDFTSGTTISSSQVDANNSEIAVALTQSIAVDGQTTTTSSIPFAADIATDVIAELTPGAGVTTDGVLLKDNAITTTKVDTAQGTPIASATTTDIGAATGQYFDISGTTTITGLGTITAGAQRVAQFDGILTLTHNGTSLILPGAANITTAAGDTAGFVSLGSGNWACEWYTAASGQALVGASAASTTVAGIVELATTAETETGTDTTRAVTPDGLHDMTTLAGASWFLDDDTMAGDDATKAVSQQSLIAYVAAQVAASSPGRVLLGTVTPSAAATFSFVNGVGGIVFDSTYDRYEFDFVNVIPATDSAQLLAQVTVSGTAQTSLYNYINRSQYAGQASPVNEGGTSTAAFSFHDSATNEGVSNVVAEGGTSGTLTAFAPSAQATSYAKFRWEFAHMNASVTSEAGITDGAGTWVSATGIDGVQFKFSTGNVTSGTVHLYGIKI